ncbi:MAG TPA: exodeoxyribonuclease III [Candidatus Saccharimonadales bacterium]
MITIYSWNVNGIRAVIKKELWQKFVDEASADIICLQETKAKPEQVELELPGYDQFWYSAERAGYSGVALFSKIAPAQVVNGLPQDIIKQFDLNGDHYGDPNKEGRVLAAEFEKFWLMTVYTPNAKDDLSRVALRHKHWDPAFLAYAEQLEASGKPVVFCGDLNVAHTEDDLANPKPNRGKKGFTDEEREGFQNFVDAGFVDTFRMFKQGNGYYTWWSHFANSRARNVGWRIDYFLASESLRDRITGADIHPKVMGSDHCPVSVTLDI